MSLDKFVMRGFTGSLGSGEGRWVSTGQTSQGASQRESVISHQGGTSFIMGGGPLKAKPGAKSDERGGYEEERYSFDARDIREKGTSRTRGSDKDSGGQSLVDLANTKRGHQVVVGIAMYGLFLILGITVLIIVFGGGSNDGFYSAPAGFSREMRPMWER